jgi:hypothetical protein
MLIHLGKHVLGQNDRASQKALIPPPPTDEEIANDEVLSGS